MEFLKKLCSFLYSLLFIVGSVVVSVYIVVNIRSFYSNQYVKLGVDRDTGMSFEDLDRTTDVLLDYLNDKKENLSVIVVKNGVPAQAFYEREILHMVDVKNLYRMAVRVGISSWLMASASACILYFLCGADKYKMRRYLVGGYKKRCVAFLAFFAFMGLAMAIDFNRFWTTFHLIFFDNDLWLLDPRYSTMINMFPEPFFFAMCIRILFLFGRIFAAFSFILLTVAKKKQPK